MELRLHQRLSTAVGMATDAMAHMTTDPHTAAVVDDPTATGMADQADSQAATVNQFDRERVDTQTAIGRETTIVGIAADEMMITEVGRGTMTETGTMTPANEGTSRGLCSHGLLGGCSHLIYLLLFLLIFTTGKGASPKCYSHSQRCVGIPTSHPSSVDASSILSGPYQATSSAKESCLYLGAYALSNSVR